MSRDPQVPALARLPRRLRLVLAAAGVLVIWLGVVLVSRSGPVDLTVVLLLLLVLVVAIAVLTGPWLGALVAFVAVGCVNWYLVPPYDTFTVSSPDNLVALVVFTLLAVLASVLVDLSARLQAAGARTRARTELLGTLVEREEPDGPVPLERVRVALDLDRLTLVGTDGGRARVLATAGHGPELPDESRRVVDVTVDNHYRLVGAGAPRLAEDPDFIRSLASAAVRSYESERMDAERQRADELAEVDSARTALLASVGHDLRTPLAGLRLSVDALRSDDGSLDPETRGELWATLDASTSRLDELIANLLDMSRLEAGVLLVRPEPVALDAVVAAVLLGRPEAPVRVDVDESLPLVLVDPALLERVLDNVVSNAVRYAGISVDEPLVVSAYADGPCVVAEVVDRGPGLRAEPLATVSSGDADRSTGLGLSIVRGFCDAMDVGLELTPTEGGGLTVRLRLPVAEPGGAGAGA